MLVLIFAIDFWVWSFYRTSLFLRSGGARAVPGERAGSPGPRIGEAEEREGEGERAERQGAASHPRQVPATGKGLRRRFDVIGVSSSGAARRQGQMRDLVIARRMKHILLLPNYT